MISSFNEWDSLKSVVVGSKNLRPVWELEGGIDAAFKGFYQNGNFNPYASVVEEIFQKYNAGYMALDPNRCNRSFILSL